VICDELEVAPALADLVDDVALNDRVNKIEENVGAIGKELRAIKASVGSVQHAVKNANVALPATDTISTQPKWYKSTGIWNAIGSCVALPLAVIIPLSLRSCDRNDQNEANKMKLAVTSGIADSKLGDRMQGVEQRVSGVEASIQELNVFLPSLTREQWKRNSSVAPAPKSISEIKTLVAVSKRLNITSVPVSDVESVGKRLLPLAEKSPEAWSAALDVASYRSVLNAPDLPAYPQQLLMPPPNGTSWQYNLVHVNNLPAPYLSFSSDYMLPTREAARLDLIGIDQNKSKPVAPGWLFARGEVTSLDSMHIRNVVFIGAEVHYSGKPVILEMAVFINCTFVFDNDERGRELSAKLLESSRVNFKTS
jgi:hypothetical protein